MAMTNAEKQAAFRERRKSYIRGLERKLRNQPSAKTVESREFRSQQAAVSDEETVETKTDPYAPEFPKYPRSSRGVEDISALVIQNWLEKELLADRLSPMSLHMIGVNAQHLAKLWMPKSGRGRLKNKKTVS